MIVYIAVTPDKYELPIVIADSLKEISLKTGVNKQAISDNISKNTNGKRIGIKFVKVEIGDE